MSDVFVPYDVCSVPSGDCFAEGKCLDNCRPRHNATVSQQLRALQERCTGLEVRIIQLERARKS